MKIFVVKYLVLLAALISSIYVLMVKHSFSKNMLYLVIGLTVLFLILQILDYFMSRKKEDMPANGYVYFTNGFVTKKIIRIGAYIIATVVLLISGNKVMLFGIVLLGLMVSEIIMLILELKNGNYFIYFDDKAIIVNFESKRLFPSHVTEIAFRFDIFYLTLKNDHVRMIVLSKLKEEDIPRFKAEFISWANQNNLPFTHESKEKLGLIPITTIN